MSLLALLMLPAALSRHAAASEPTVDCRGCNVILVSIDTLRADSLGFMGSRRGVSPNMDRLARQGAWFPNAYSQSNITLPSHMSMLTSLYPWHHKVRTIYRDRLDWGVPTLAKMLQKSGYTTVWAATASPMLDLEAGFGEGIDVAIHSRTWDRPLEWISRNRHQRFFMFLHTRNVHSPYVPDQDSIAKFATPAEAGETISREELNELAIKELRAHPEKHVPAKKVESYRKVLGRSDPAERTRGLKAIGAEPFAMLWHKLFWDRFDTSREEDVRRLRLLYDIGVYDADRRIGALIRTLKESGLQGRTLLILTSDHGEAFGEHGQFEHSTLYQECLHVPLILLFPNGPADLRIPEVVQSVDIMPTILDAVALAPPARMDGKSLLPLIHGQRSQCGYAVGAWGRRRVIRDCRYTYHMRLSQEAGGMSAGKLFDRSIDPTESRDIASENPDVAARLKSRLLELLRDDPKARTTDEIAPSAVPEAARERMTSLQLERLKIMGYLEL